MEILYSDEDIEITIELIGEDSTCFGHTLVKSWSLSKYKKYLKIFAIEKEKLRLRGITRVFALPPSEREEKWERLMGFIDTGFKVGPYKLMVLK